MSWVRRSTAVDRREDPADFYQWFWWVESGSDRERAPFTARGMSGQVIAVVPDADTVVVRLGNAEAGIDWSAFALDLADRLARPRH